MVRGKHCGFRVRAFVIINLKMWPVFCIFGLFLFSCV